MTSTEYSAKRVKRFPFSVGLKFGIGLVFRLGHDSEYWLGLGFGSEIRAKVMSHDCSLESDLVKALIISLACFSSCTSTTILRE